MIKIYEMETCPDCTYVEEQVKGNNICEEVSRCNRCKFRNRDRTYKTFLRAEYPKLELSNMMCRPDHYRESQRVCLQQCLYLVIAPTNCAFFAYNMMYI